MLWCGPQPASWWTTSCWIFGKPLWWHVGGDSISNSPGLTSEGHWGCKECLSSPTKEHSQWRMVQGWNSNSMFNAFSLSLSQVPPTESHWPWVPPAPCSLLFKNVPWIHWSWFYILLKDSDMSLIHPSTHICSSSWNRILSSPAPSCMVPTARSCPLSQLQCHPIRTSFPVHSVSPIFSPKLPPSWQWAQGDGLPVSSWVLESSLVAQLGKESPCSVEDLGLIPGLGRSPGEGNSNPLQQSCLENPMDRGALQGSSPWGHKESTQLNSWHTHSPPGVPTERSVSLSGGQKEDWMVYHGLWSEAAPGGRTRWPCSELV